MRWIRKNWKETEATVFTCGVQTHYRPGDVGYKDYLITFSYEIDGEWHSGEFNSPSPRQEGSKFQLKYDPAHPERNMHSPDGPLLKILTWIGAAIICAALLWLKNWWNNPK